MKPSGDVYCLQEEYKQAKYKNFHTNLYNLHKVCQKLGRKAGVEDTALFTTSSHQD